MGETESVSNDEIQIVEFILGDDQFAINLLALRQFQWVRYSLVPNFCSWLLLKNCFGLLFI